MLRRPHPLSPLSRIFHGFTACLLVFMAAALAVTPLAAPFGHPAQAQQATPAGPLAGGVIADNATVAALIARMSVQQRVGQLFNVKIAGNLPTSGISPEIADLITTYHIGGVQLAASTHIFDNSLADPPVTQQIARLTNALQTLTVLTSTSATEVIPPSATKIAPAPTSSLSVDDTPTSTLGSCRSARSCGPPAGVTSTPTLSTTSIITADVHPPTPSIPLFVALSQNADTTGRMELSEITQGLTPLPSQMAVGATWNPSNAELLGEILGGELPRLGINMLFGPALDVADAPRPNTSGDLDTQVFGGNPFWVGKLGSAFISGVHRGSKNRIAVVAKTFPGLGASDRDARQEIPTVQKSIDQLKQIELAPFFAVMRSDPARDPASEHTDSVTDGVMVAHVRYRSAQGTTSANTRPVSLDPNAYQVLMTLPEVQPWRSTGGVTFSDSLGAPSIRRFYDATEKSFPARRIAQEAFAAGNDVLVLGDFGLTSSWDEQLVNIKDVIRFFWSQYQQDPNFRTRVDESLARILSLKLRMYGGKFDGQDTHVDEQTAALLTPQTNVVAGMAKEGITLLSPAPHDPSGAPLAQPGKDENIVFITDDRSLQECDGCTPYPAVSRTALQDLALKLYGPSTTSLVDTAHISSFTVRDLSDYNLRTSPPASGTVSSALTSTTVTTRSIAAAAIKPTRTALSAATTAKNAASSTATTEAASPQDFKAALTHAQWIVIALIDAGASNQARGASGAGEVGTIPSPLRTFLSQSTDMLRDKHVVVLALGAPYYLDATEISKVTAYYGVYSRTPVFLENAIRALFGEFVPKGASPVDVTGLTYSLASQTAPNPAQTIPLSYGNIVTGTPSTPAPLELKIGDQIKLRAGPVLDLNGHLVPDRTLVRFVLSYPNESVVNGPVETHDGIAETNIPLERKGKINIRAEAAPALTSVTIAVNVADTVSIAAVTPTPAPTVPPPTAAPNAPQVTAVATAASSAPPVNVNPLRASLPGFVLTFAGLLLVGLGAFGLLTFERIENLPSSARLRIALGLWIAGWLAYVMVAVGLPGTRWLTNSLNWGGSVLAALVIAMLAAAIIVIAARFNAQTQRQDVTPVQPEAPSKPQATTASSAPPVPPASPASAAPAAPPASQTSQTV